MIQFLEIFSKMNTIASVIAAAFIAVFFICLAIGSVVDKLRRKRQRK